jgi:hypothetical protein
VESQSEAEEDELAAAVVKAVADEEQATQRLGRLIVPHRAAGEDVAASATNSGSASSAFPSERGPRTILNTTNRDLVCSAVGDTAFASMTDARHKIYYEARVGSFGRYVGRFVNDKGKLCLIPLSGVKLVGNTEQDHRMAIQRVYRDSILSSMAELGHAGPDSPEEGVSDSDAASDSSSAVDSDVSHITELHSSWVDSDCYTDGGQSDC